MSLMAVVDCVARLVATGDGLGDRSTHIWPLAEWAWPGIGSCGSFASVFMLYHGSVLLERWLIHVMVLVDLGVLVWWWRGLLRHWSIFLMALGGYLVVIVGNHYAIDWWLATASWKELITVRTGADRDEIRLVSPTDKEWLGAGSNLHSVPSWVSAWWWVVTGLSGGGSVPTNIWERERVLRMGFDPPWSEWEIRSKSLGMKEWIW